MSSRAQENKYWEESFRVYERGVSLFKYPHVRDIWLAYLQQFVQRYGGTKLERARDLFKQALSQVSFLYAVSCVSCVEQECSYKAHCVCMTGDKTTFQQSMS